MDYLVDWLCQKACENSISAYLYNSFLKVHYSDWEVVFSKLVYKMCRLQSLIAFVDLAIWSFQWFFYKTPVNKD